MDRNAIKFEESQTLSRPKILVHTARIGARHYRRERDLPGAVPGLLNQPVRTIIPRLIDAEARCEEARLAHSAAYRPGKHVQVMAALLAESAAAESAGETPV